MTKAVHLVDALAPSTRGPASAVSTPDLNLNEAPALTGHLRPRTARTESLRVSGCAVNPQEAPQHLSAVD